MIEELKNCPICDDSPNHAPIESGGHRVFCDQGVDEHIIIVYGENENDAFKKWNTRTRPSLMDEEEIKTFFKSYVSHCGFTLKGCKGCQDEIARALSLPQREENKEILKETSRMMRDSTYPDSSNILESLTTHFKNGDCAVVGPNMINDIRKEIKVAKAICQHFKPLSIKLPEEKEYSEKISDTELCENKGFNEAIKIIKEMNP